MAFSQGGSSSTVSRSKLEFRREPREKPSEQDENQQQTQPTCDAGSGKRTRPGHSGGTRVLSLLCRPCSPIPVPPSLFPLKWLKDTKAFKCYGCDSPIQVPGEIHDPPNDVIASTNEYKLFMKDGKLQIHLIYHLRAACIPARIPVNTIGK